MWCNSIALPGCGINPVVFKLSNVGSVNHTIATRDQPEGSAWPDGAAFSHLLDRIGIVALHRNEMEQFTVESADRSESGVA